LLHLAPHLAKDDAQRFWALVSDCVTLPTEPNALLDEPKVAALHANVRAALGQDDRFEPDFPFVMTKRFGTHTQDDEPIPGFVRTPQGDFMMGHRSVNDNPPHHTTIYSEFYIARTLTTVAQYALFVQSEGYNVGEPDLKSHAVNWLVPKKARSSPKGWLEQLAYPNRPVTNITWFEARSYTYWLTEQMRKTLDEAGLSAYVVRLPMEPEWERASRATSLSESHDKRWPWGDDASIAAQSANLASTGIAHTSTVGVFAPNAIGLHDIAGNVWEWMDNRYELSKNEELAQVQRTIRYEPIATDPVSLRGGSCIDHPADASCSDRLLNLPGRSTNAFGLRVALCAA
jgi:formylglycine-generating enzyme required for sulfatase activity